MAKRYFVMLAHVFKPEKHQSAGAFISEKLEGMRAFWDGGVSRGIKKRDVPYANTDKDEVHVYDHVSTGLWSRLGNVIHAPDWWLDKLPKIPLDGELYIGRGQWQYMMSVVKDYEPGPGWEEVKYYCFDMPAPDTIFANGPVAFSSKQEKYFYGALDWYNQRSQLEYRPKPDTPFRSTYFLLKKYLEGNTAAIAHLQETLPYGEFAIEIADAKTRGVVEGGGEGCIIRDPESKWLPNRCHTIVKCKVRHDAEAIVMGYTTGRATDRGSRLLGKMGALILNFNGQRFEISGFTDAERLFSTGEAVKWAEENPGVDTPEWIEAIHFPRGTEVTFTYRSLSRDLIPTEAQYKRRA